MERYMKRLPLALLVLTTSFAYAGTIDLRAEGRTGSFCPSQELSYNVNPEDNFVEKMLVSAEGIRHEGFIKVYADGEMIQNIGVPGRDPDYTFRVRRNVNNITLKFEETCSIIHNVKLFTVAERAPLGYHRYHRDSIGQDNWGSEFMEIVRSLSMDLYESPDFANELYPKVLLPMKKIALMEDVSESVRDERSLITGERALQLAQVISKNQKFLDRLLVSGRFDYVVRDLLRIKEDILERYDVKEKNLASEISKLEAEIDN
jgi:hypothetical protein